MYQEDQANPQLSPQARRDLALAVFFDRLVAILDMCKPLIKSVVEEAVREQQGKRCS